MLHYIRVERFAAGKHSSLLDQFLSYKENEVLQIWTYLQPYEWAQLARVPNYIRMQRFYAVKHSSLLDQFVSYKENEVLWIRPLDLNSQHFIFFVTYEWAQ